MKSTLTLGLIFLLTFCLAGLCAQNAQAEPKNAKKNAKELDPKDAAFIVVRATFSDTTVTIDDQPYPENSEFGAVVAPNKNYEVVVTDKKSSATKRYSVKLGRGEARVIIVDLSGGTGGSSSPRATTAKAKQAVPKADKETGSGFLTVNASPTAQVYIDGKLVASKTPLVKHTVNKGNHTVRVYYVDLKKFSETKRAMISDGRHVNLYFQSND